MDEKLCFIRGHKMKTLKDECHAWMEKYNFISGSWIKILEDELGALMKN